MNQQAQTQKLYVGNLNFDANEDQVRELFGTFGQVEDVKIVMDRFSGRSRGFAFVRMDSADSATKRKMLSTANLFKEKLSSSTGRAQNSVIVQWASAANVQLVKDSVRAVKVAEAGVEIVVGIAASVANTAVAAIAIAAADSTTANSPLFLRIKKPESKRLGFFYLRE
jgi:hypothetical protein